MAYHFNSGENPQSSYIQKQTSPPDISESASTFQSNKHKGCFTQIITVIICGLIGGGIAALATGDAERFWVGFAMGAIFIGLTLALH